MYIYIKKWLNLCEVHTQYLCDRLWPPALSKFTICVWWCVTTHSLKLVICVWLSLTTHSFSHHLCALYWSALSHFTFTLCLQFSRHIYSFRFHPPLIFIAWDVSLPPVSQIHCVRSSIHKVSYSVNICSVHWQPYNLYMMVSGHPLLSHFKA